LSSTYSISITGIQEGIARDTAIKQIAELLKVSEEKVISMLASPKFVVKSGIDLSTSAKYEAALRKCGCYSVVEPESGAIDLEFDLPESGQKERNGAKKTQTTNLEPQLADLHLWDMWNAASKGQKISTLVLVIPLLIMLIMYIFGGQPKYSAETVAGKFEVINIDKDGGGLVYKLGGKVVSEFKEMHGVTAEIHDVYNLNDRTLLVVTWNINNSKIGPYKFSTFFIDIDKNGNFSEVFDKGIPRDEKHIDVVKSPEKLEFKIRVESDKVGYQLVVFDGNGARQISDWKWADENREKERQQQSKFVQQNNPGIDVVGTYANNVAAMVEQSPNLACLALANNIRSFGNSGAPAYVRERQVEAMIDKLPNICIPSGLR